MLQWDPATDTEAAMRDALAAADQDSYFRILARTDLLLPVSAEALAGRAPMGWGTWTTGNRTHVLAFTSPAAMRLCLNEPYGSYRSVPFSTLAHEWPNHEWWLAINPGLPIEAYLPSWFISQLVRGEVRLPGRTGARARMAQSDLAAAISGRIRAAERSRAAAASRAAPPPATPPSTELAPYGGPPYAPPHGSGYGLSAGSGYGSPGGYGQADAHDVYGWAEAYQHPGSAYGGQVYGPLEGHRRSDGYQAAPSYGPVDGGSAVGPQPYQAEPYQTEPYQTEPYQAEPAPPPTRVTATVGPPTVETVDAEIIDAGPAPADRDGSTNDAASEPTTRMAGRDLGARLREHQAYAADGYPADGHGAVGGHGAAHDREAAHVAETYVAETYVAEAYVAEAYVAGSDTYRSDAASPSTEGPSVRAEPPPAPAPTRPSSWTPRRGMIEDAEIVEPSEATGFVPANETEAKLLSAVESNNTDAYLSTLLLARVILPVPISMPPGSRPRDKYFPWQIEEVDGERRISVFTSAERLADYGQDRFGSDMSTMSVSFIELIEAWPSPRIQFAINPETPVGTTLPGSQVVALASWAAEVGLRHDSPSEVAPRKPGTTASAGVAGAPTVGAENAVLMQRAVPPAQLPFYLERGYDRVSGFVNRASEVAHLKTPQALYRALGLVYPGSPFSEDDAEVHVLRWVAHRPDLYRLPYGGQNEAAMRAMQGWVIERPPFRGNGFAPGDTDVVAEFKVDSVRLPHGAQMWRLTREGTEELVATFDADKGRWVRTP
jgi:hypothetical protein